MTQFRLTPAQQSAGVDRIAENIALRSGAGCGKTFVLARRFTELLMNCDDSHEAMSSFVALTFTDKAAAEMSQRVADMLKNFADTATSSTERRKFLAWLDQVPEARISTIHSFCASVLRSCAIEAGIDPNFTVCSETIVSDQLLLEACESAVLSALVFTEDPTEGFTEKMAELFTSCTFNQVVEKVQHLAKNRSRIEFDKYLDPDATFNRWNETIAASRIKAAQKLADDEIVPDALVRLKQQHCSDPADKLYSGFARTIEIVESIIAQPLEQSAELFTELDAIKPGNCGSAKNWGGKDKPKLTRGIINELRGAVLPYALFSESLGQADRLAAGVLATLSQLAINANELYRKIKLSRGIVDFTDLLVLGRNVIKNNPTLRAALTEGIAQVLIDEAQDTDVTQLELLLDIVTPDDSHCEILPGKLFLVGDAKQSIYRFRGAQKQVFDGLCSQLGDAQRVDLDMSFRTHGAGVGFINRIFPTLLGESYSPISTNRNEVPDLPSVEILLADGSEKSPLVSAAGSSTAQAALTAQRIDEMITNGEKRVWDDDAKRWRGVKPGDIAILFAGMTHALKYERQLQKRNIPYYVVAGRGFYNRQEVYNLLNALRVIDNPSDDIAFIGLLRSEIVGIDDNALMHITQTFDSPYLPDIQNDAFENEKIAELLTEHQLGQLRFTCNLICGLNKRKDSLGTDELLTLILNETGYTATLLGQFQGKRMLGNVQMLLEKARSVGSQISLSEFVKQIGEHIVDESDKHEQASVSAEDENVVRLMTIHKAKGLEFPVVFVPELNVVPKPVKGQLLNVYEWGLTTKILPQQNSDELFDREPLSFRLAKEQEKRDQQSETFRKYYVALTRHEDHLVLVGANYRYKDKDKIKGIRSNGSFLQLLDEQLNFTDAIEAWRRQIPYSDGEKSGVKNFEISLRCEVPKSPRAEKFQTPAGRSLLDKTETSAEFTSQLEQLARSSTSKVSPPPLLGMISPLAGDVELAVTALNEFAQCPMLYRWRYELRGGSFGNVSAKNVSPQSQAVGTSTLDPLALGTFLHRCMELLDFQNPQSSAELVTRVASETNLDAAEIRLITPQLEMMLRTFAKHELSAVLAGVCPNDIYRELDFVSDYGSARLRGQIDLLYRDGNNWCVLDYKSDRVDEIKNSSLVACGEKKSDRVDEIKNSSLVACGEKKSDRVDEIKNSSLVACGEKKSDRVDEVKIAQKAARYELQMLIYAAAAGRLTNTLPCKATLYFLRTGATHTFEITQSTIDAANTRITNIAENLIKARRTGNFTACNRPGCDFCRFL